MKKEKCKRKKMFNEKWKTNKFGQPNVWPGEGGNSGLFFCVKKPSLKGQ